MAAETNVDAGEILRRRVGREEEGARNDG